MKNMKRVILIAVLSFFPLNPFSFSAEKEMYLEGIAYESSNPSESIAVINGGFLKQGATVEGYKITEIKPNLVKITKADGSGEERELRITGGAKAAVPGAIPTGPRMETEAPERIQAGPPVSSEEQVQKLMSEAMTNPLAILGKAKEMGALADVKQVHSAAMAYFSQEMPGGEMTVDTLVEAGMIAPSYKGGIKNGYKYTLKPGKEGVGLNADPVDPNFKKHFFIDEWGELHAEEGKPATANSPDYRL